MCRMLMFRMGLMMNVLVRITTAACVSDDRTNRNA